jgi:hypothetical protein
MRLLYKFCTHSVGKIKAWAVSELPSFIVNCYNIEDDRFTLFVRFNSIFKPLKMMNRPYFYVNLHEIIWIQMIS